MNEKEKRVVMAVFSELVRMDEKKLNSFLGSITIKEMKEMYYRFKYEPYCKKHGIRYEDMTEDDFEQVYMEDN